MRRLRILLHFVLELAEPTDREESRKLHLTVQDSTEKNEQPNADYQLVPKSRSTVSRDYAIPQIQNSIDAVADTIVNAADEVVEGLGDLITPSTQGNDLTEAAWQRKLRYQANRKKKRVHGQDYCDYRGNKAYCRQEWSGTKGLLYWF